MSSYAVTIGVSSCSDPNILMPVAEVTSTYIAGELPTRAPRPFRRMYRERLGWLNGAIQPINRDQRGRPGKHGARTTRALTSWVVQLDDGRILRDVDTEYVVNTCAWAKKEAEHNNGECTSPVYFARTLREALTHPHVRRSTRIN